MVNTLESSSRVSPLQPEQSRAVSLIEDGVLTGICGAAVVALWFLILDLARGQMFLTPTLVGSVVFLGQSPEQVTSVNALIVFAYTGLHGVLFLVAGLVLARLFVLLERNPQFGIVILLLFLLFESIVFSFAAAIFPLLLGAVGAAAVAAGNLFAAIAMFWFLLRRHPAAMTQLRRAWQEE